MNEPMKRNEVRNSLNVKSLSQFSTPKKDPKCMFIGKYCKKISKESSLEEQKETDFNDSVIDSDEDETGITAFKSNRAQTNNILNNKSRATSASKCKVFSP